MTTQIDTYTKQLEQCYNSMFTIVMKLVTGPKYVFLRLKSIQGGE